MNDTPPPSAGGQAVEALPDWAERFLRDAEFAEFMKMASRCVKMADEIKALRAGKGVLEEVPMSMSSVSPLNGDHAVIISELAENAMYWRGIDMTSPDDLAMKQAASNFCVVLRAMRVLGITMVRKVKAAGT
jgi:hypothetical protein